MEKLLFTPMAVQEAIPVRLESELLLRTEKEI